MRLVADVGRLLVETIRFSLATRRLSLLVTIVVGMLIAALSIAAHVLAPLAFYPFA